jgi:hypothetical protein
MTLIKNTKYKSAKDRFNIIKKAKKCFSIKVSSKPICHICGKEINERIIPCNLNNEHFHQKCYDNSPAGKKALKEFNKFINKEHKIKEKKVIAVFRYKNHKPSIYYDEDN